MWRPLSPPVWTDGTRRVACCINRSRVDGYADRRTPRSLAQPCTKSQRDAEIPAVATLVVPASLTFTEGSTDIPGPKAYCSTCFGSSKTSFTGTRCTTFT